MVTARVTAHEPGRRPGHVRLGTRGSQLALAQTELVRRALLERHPRLTCELTTVHATADRSPDAPLIALGGEGIFVKELEQALLEGAIDLAVHSLKDLPLAEDPRLRLAAVTRREEPRDALISRAGQALRELPAGATLGTSSLRRQSQLRRVRPDLIYREIRGNVDTRLRKVREGPYDAIVVAACGLARLGRLSEATELLPFDVMLPEPGQGALALQVRAEDVSTAHLCVGLHEPATEAAVTAERAFLKGLGGGCRVPIAAYAELRDSQVYLEGLVVSADGAGAVRGRLSGPSSEARQVGERLAERLRAQGAERLLTRDTRHT